MQAIPIQQVAGGEILVNGHTITEDAIDQEVQYHPASSLQEARKEAARALSIRTMLITEAARQGITGEDRQTAESQEEAQIRQLLDQELDNPEPDEAACRQYFESNRERFRTPANTASPTSSARPGRRRRCPRSRPRTLPPHHPRLPRRPEPLHSNRISALPLPLRGIRRW